MVSLCLRKKISTNPKRILILCDDTIGDVKSGNMKTSEALFTFLCHGVKDSREIYEKEQKLRRLSTTGYDTFVIMTGSNNIISPVNDWARTVSESKIRKCVIVLPRNYHFTENESSKLLKMHEIYPNLEYSTVLLDLFLPKLYLHNNRLTKEGRKLVLDSFVNEAW